MSKQLGATLLVALGFVASTAFASPPSCSGDDTLTTLQSMIKKNLDLSTAATSPLYPLYQGALTAVMAKLEASPEYQVPPVQEPESCKVPGGFMPGCPAYLKAAAEHQAKLAARDQWLGAKLQTTFTAIRPEDYEIDAIRLRDKNPQTLAVTCAARLTLDLKNIGFSQSIEITYTVEAIEGDSKNFYITITQGTN